MGKENYKNERFSHTLSRNPNYIATTVEAKNSVFSENNINSSNNFPYKLSLNNKALLNNRLNSLVNPLYRNNNLSPSQRISNLDLDQELKEDLDYNYLISDFGNFNFDREKISKLNLDKISKTILNNNHLILKLTEGNLDCSMDSELSGSHNKSVLNTSNVLSISAFTNEEHFLIDKNNDLNRTNEYITIKSNIINSCNVSRMSIKSEEENINKDTNNERCDELLSALNKKDFESIVFMFEIFFIILWSKEFLMLNNIQEECLILIIEINDDYTNKEKVFLRISDEESNKFIPFNTKNSAKDSSFKFIRVIKRPEANNYEKSVHKISLKICNYSKDILSIICEEEIFLNTRQEGSLHKYKFYKNMYGSLQNKKRANILFNITYKKNDFYCNNNTYTNQDSSVYSEYNTNCVLNNLSKIEKFSNFHEETALPFIYYGIKNQTILLNGSSSKLPDADLARNQRTNFFSIHEIEELEISGELKSESIPVERLIDLLSISKKKFELYEILRKINYLVMKKEIAFENMVLIMHKITLRLDEIKFNFELHDEVLTPYIYFVLKNILIKARKYLDSNFSGYRYQLHSKMQSNHNKNNFNDDSRNDKDRKESTDREIKEYCRNKNLSICNETNDSFAEANKSDNKNFEAYQVIRNTNNNNHLMNVNNSNVLNTSNPIYANKSNNAENIKEYYNNYEENSGKKITFNKDVNFTSSNCFDNLNSKAYEKEKLIKNKNKEHKHHNNNNSIYDKSHHDPYINSSRNNQDHKSFKEIILKSFFLAMKNIEFQTNSNFSNNANLNIFNENLRKRTSINYDSFFNWNRKKISASVSYIAKLFEDFISISYNKIGNNITLKVNLKENENSKSASNGSLPHISDIPVTCQIDQKSFLIFLNNLYYLMNFGCNFYDNADLVLNILTIHLKIIRNKEFGNLKEIMFENVLTDEIYFNISKNFKNNINIQTNLYHLSSIYYNFINANFPEISKFNLENIIDFNDLLETFTSFKTTGFDQIHETILNLIKTLLTTKKKIISAFKREEENNNFSLNNTQIIQNNYDSNNNEISLDNNNNKTFVENENINKSMSTQLKSEDANQNLDKKKEKEKEKEKENRLNVNILSMLSDSEVKTVVGIFTKTLKLLKEKILSFDIQRMLKWTQNIMTIVYSVANISNNLLKGINFCNLNKIYYEENFIEELIDILSALSEAGLFAQIDLLYGKIDEISLNVKSIIFRTLYNCIILIKSIREAEKNSMTKSSAEKIFKFIKKLEENDNKFNPLIMKERIQLQSLKSNQKQQNLVVLMTNPLINSNNFDHLMEYYTRYKSILKDFLRDTIVFIKQSQRKII